jgi:hypothetical protein
MRSSSCRRRAIEAFTSVVGVVVDDDDFVVTRLDSTSNNNSLRLAVLTRIDTGGGST